VESAVLSNFDGQSSNLQLQTEGRLPIAWVNGSGVEMVAGMPVLSLEITALKNGNLSQLLRIESGGMTAEAVQSNNSVRPVTLRWESASQMSAQPVAMIPNPAQDVCFLVFDADRDADRLLQMLDVQGKVVFEKTMAVQRGTNRIELRPVVSPSGLCIVKMDGVAVGKVLFLKN